MIRFSNPGISTSLAIGIIVVLAVVVGGGVLFYQYYYLNPKPVACTEEAKICPDGSTVGRTGPNCEFTPCPDETADWKIYRNEEYEFEFKYPKEGVVSNFSLYPSEFLFYVERFPVAIDNKYDGLKFDKLIVSVSGQDSDDCKIDSNTYPDVYNFNNNKFKERETWGGANYTSYHNYEYFIVQNNKCFVLSFALYKNLNTGNNEVILPRLPSSRLDMKEPDIFRKILSTFKFTK